MHQVHRDHVTSLPPNFSLLGNTVDCAIQGMTSPSTATSLADVQILTLQGHPEFSPDIVTALINMREEKGIITKDLADKSRQYAALHDEGLRAGATILQLMLIS